MPIVPFDSLPDESRVWVFGSDRPLRGDAAAQLLEQVDAFLAQWRAHGAPLFCARDWRDDRFLTIAVDTTQENASGCSIDGLFRGLQTLERELGTRLVGGGRVFYRDTGGAVQVASRDQFAELAEGGTVSPDTHVLDTSLTSMSDWRTRFDVPARESWTASMFARD